MVYIILLLLLFFVVVIITSQVFCRWLYKIDSFRKRESELRRYSHQTGLLQGLLHIPNERLMRQEMLHFNIFV